MNPKELRIELVENKEGLKLIEELEKKSIELKSKRKKGIKKYFLIIYLQKIIGFIDSNVKDEKLTINQIFLLKRYKKKDFENSILSKLYNYTISNKLVLVQKREAIMELFFEIMAHLLTGIAAT